MLISQDPYPKPCYLFALVAGDLKMKEDTFTTASGRQVSLRIFTQPANISQVGFAMEALKKSMKWDEEVFGLEYDLDLFNIVAVDDFNMGAMENKSLNIFNSRYVCRTNGGLKMLSSVCIVVKLQLASSSLRFLKGISSMR